MTGRERKSAKGTKKKNKKRRKKWRIGKKIRRAT